MIKKLKIYLPQDTIAVIDSNPKHFYAHVQRAFQGIGFDVQQIIATEANLKASFDPSAYCLFHRNTPHHPHAIEARPAPMGLFWMLDKTASPAEKLVFKAKFKPENIDTDLAEELIVRFRKKYGQINQETSHESGFVLVALQGALDRRRHWQTMSPIEMVKQTIEIEKERQVLIKLHPTQTYSDEEIRAVHELADGARVQVVEGELNALLEGCAYTVSMNSTVSIKGLVFEKPGILFGDAEFHHPFQSVPQNGVVDSFDRVLADGVEAGKYLLWYLRRQHVATYKPTIEQDILRRCAVLGWDLGNSN